MSFTPVTRCAATISARGAAAKRGVHCPFFSATRQVSNAVGRLRNTPSATAYPPSAKTAAVLRAAP